MSYRFYALLFIGLLATGPVVAQPEPTAEDAAMVRATVQNYFDGIMRYDVHLLQEAFHPDAHIMTFFPQLASGATAIYYNRSLAAWLMFTKGNRPTDLSGYTNQIASVDITGYAAMVKTEMDWPTVRYVDYLSLLKVDGTWRIMNKIWYEERK